MGRTWSRLVKEDDGQAVVETSLLLALVALAAVAGVTSLGREVLASFDRSVQAIVAALN